MKHTDSQKSPRTEPDLCLTELLRQAMAGLMPSGTGLNALMDRMEGRA